MLPRVQLGATSLPSAPSIPSLLGKWPGYGQLRQEREREASRALPTWTHKQACLFCHSPAAAVPPSLEAVHCIAAYAAYVHILPPPLQHTLSLCGLSLLFLRQDSGLKIENSPPPSGQNPNQGFLGDITFCWGG